MTEVLGEHGLLLVLAVAVALMFEFVNGFHDTANAVATVIYTRSMQPRWAVLYSGLLNFLGVLLAGVGVAYSIIHLFPLSHMTAGGDGMTLIFAVLLAAIAWNVGTWYLGLPASSSHAMIGSIIGASMAFCLHHGLPLESAVPWEKARQVVLALFISPLFGFAAAALLLWLMKKVIKDDRLFQEPEPDAAPPRGIRALLIGTCGAVSFAHGSNDGQKGMGLVMLILMGLAPAHYCLNLESSPAARQQTAALCRQAAEVAPPLQVKLQAMSRTWSQLETLPPDQRPLVRHESEELVRQLKNESRNPAYSDDQKDTLERCAKALEDELNYVSLWVKIAVALALGIGTMVGWKRIVVTVGEKIGKTHLTMGQGACAEMIAASTIMLADVMKLPVSTTHVLSSGVAGTMYAQKSGLQKRTVMGIAAAWVLTMPVCVTLAYGLFQLIASL